MSWNTILIILDVIFIIAFVVFLFAEHENGFLSSKYNYKDVNFWGWVIFVIIGIVLLILSIIQWAPNFFPSIKEIIISIELFSKNNWGPILVSFIVSVLLIFFFKYVVFLDLWYPSGIIVTSIYIFLGIVAFISFIMLLGAL